MATTMNRLCNGLLNKGWGMESRMEKFLGIARWQFRKLIRMHQLSHVIY